MFAVFAFLPLPNEQGNCTVREGEIMETNFLPLPNEQGNCTEWAIGPQMMFFLPLPNEQGNCTDASQDVAGKDISRLCPPKIKPPPAHLPTLDLAFSNTAHAGIESCEHTSRWPRPPCSSAVSVPSNGQSPARRTRRAHP